jgi:hypothetical protein
VNRAPPPIGTAAAPVSCGDWDNLYERMENPLFRCRFRWQPGPAAFRDTPCTPHRALRGYWPRTRAGRRATVGGGKPVCSISPRSGHRFAAENATKRMDRERVLIRFRRNALWPADRQPFRPPGGSHLREPAPAQAAVIPAAKGGVDRSAPAADRAVSARETEK